MDECINLKLIRSGIDLLRFFQNEIRLHPTLSRWIDEYMVRKERAFMTTYFCWIVWVKSGNWGNLCTQRNRRVNFKWKIFDELKHTDFHSGLKWNLWIFFLSVYKNRVSRCVTTRYTKSLYEYLISKWCRQILMNIIKYCSNEIVEQNFSTIHCTYAYTPNPWIFSYSCSSSSSSLLAMVELLNTFWL